MSEIQLSVHSAKENLTSPSTHNLVQTGSFASPRWEATGALVLVGQSRSQPSRWHSGICSGQLPTCRCTCRGTPFPSAQRWLWPTWLLRLQTRTDGLGQNKNIMFDIHAIRTDKKWSGNRVIDGQLFSLYFPWKLRKKAWRCSLSAQN